MRRAGLQLKSGGVSTQLTAALTPNPKLRNIQTNSMGGAKVKCVVVGDVG